MTDYSRYGGVRELLRTYIDNETVLDQYMGRLDALVAMGFPPPTNGYDFGPLADRIGLIDRPLPNPFRLIDLAVAWLDQQRIIANVRPSGPAPRLAVDRTEQVSTPGSRQVQPTQTGARNSDEVIQAELLRNHGYKTGGSVGNYQPIGVRELAKRFVKQAEESPPDRPFDPPSAPTISRWFKDNFGGHDTYTADCANDSLGYKLAILEGEATPAMLKRFQEERERD